jgi:hypothetical protein
MSPAGQDLLQFSQTDTEILAPLAREAERFEREEVSTQRRKRAQQPLSAAPKVVKNIGG